MLYMLSMVMSLVNSAVALAIGQSVLLAHFTLAVLCIKIIFSFIFVRQIRNFLRILANIFKGILPFLLILVLFTGLAMLDGYLVPNPSLNNF
jgi:hypothetical protein